MIRNPRILRTHIGKTSQTALTMDRRDCLWWSRFCRLVYVYGTIRHPWRLYMVRRFGCQHGRHCRLYRVERLSEQMKLTGESKVLLGILSGNFVAIIGAAVFF